MDRKSPLTVDEVHKYVNDRREGIIIGLTKDVEEVYQLCDPDNPNLCLYISPNQNWEALPPPSDPQEPKLAIDLVKYPLKKHGWLSEVALESDKWLYSIAEYYAKKVGFGNADKELLLKMFADVPSVCKVMEAKANKRAKVEGRGLREEKFDQVILPRLPRCKEAEANKRAKVEGRDLPKDILQEILPKLPVRDLLRLYQCDLLRLSECELWRSLIDDPYFVSNHLRKYRNNSEASHLLVVYRAASGSESEEVFLSPGDKIRKVQPLKNSFASHNLISYVNGVFLIKGIFSSFLEIVLWNPSIDKSVTVPKNPNKMFKAMRDATYFELGLGYDASCNNYKVIAIVYPDAKIKYHFGERYRATAPVLVQVYTLGDSWRSTKLGVSPPPYWTVGKQVYVNGAIHWINFGPIVTDDDSWSMTRDSYIVLFDVEIEVFKYFELPGGMKSDDEPKEKFPTVLGGSFAIFCAHEARHDIWVMTEYGVSDSWSKMYTFTLQFDKLLHFKSNGELLFGVFGKGIKSYDINRKRVKVLNKSYPKSSKYTVYTYVESLVLLKEGKEHPS